MIGVIQPKNGTIQSNNHQPVRFMFHIISIAQQKNGTIQSNNHQPVRFMSCRRLTPNEMLGINVPRINSALSKPNANPKPSPIPNVVKVSAIHNMMLVMKVNRAHHQNSARDDLPWKSE